MGGSIFDGVSGDASVAILYAMDGSMFDIASGDASFTI